jgi:MarR family transcriptional regulator, organic hydroperoxide resistance regulator
MMRKKADAPWSAIVSLQRATHHTLELLSERLAHLGLTAAEINVLANLADGRDRTVSELGREVGSRPTTMTSILDRLTQRGLVSRTTPEGNRRIVVIALTDQGRRAARTVRAAVTDIESRLLAGLKKSEFETLRHTLGLLSGERDARLE